jgi:hypothetical protein
VQVGQQQLGDAAPGEGEAPGGQLVGHDAQGVQVGAGVHWAVVALLRGHVLGRAHDHAGGGVPGAGRGVAKLGDAEVHQLHEVVLAAALHQEHVVGFQVAVDDAAPMGAVERVAELQEDVDRHRERNLAAAHPAGEGLAVQVLHDDVVAGRRKQREVEDADDVLVADEVHRPGLVVEAPHQLGAGGHGLVQELDGHLAADDRVLGEVDGAHPAAPERPDHPEATHRLPHERVDRMRHLRQRRDGRGAQGQGGPGDLPGRGPRAVGGGVRAPAVGAGPGGRVGGRRQGRIPVSERQPSRGAAASGTP